MANNIESDASRPLLRGGHDQPQDTGTPDYATWQRKTKAFMGTKVKHYIIMGLVALDVACVLADIFVVLIACDFGTEHDHWVDDTKEALHVTGFIFSSLFVLELAVTIWVFGPR
jgi:voltage-gated hydrogen channel 1